MADVLDEETALQQAQDAVNSLYHSRDHFFETHDVTNACEKASYLEANLKETLKVLDKLQFYIDNKAFYFSLRGKALNITAQYDAKAEDFLSKAVKLDPSLIEAWNNLGECYWKNKSVEAAKNCFTCALAKKREKTTLRNLSMVLRQIGKDQNEALANIKESVSIAKEAVGQDLNDGRSWFVLGNAFLSLFFLGGQSPGALKQAMAAYTRAGADSVEVNNPDLHFNKSMAFKYQEDYQMALDGFNRAGQLDPDWSDPINESKKLVEFLRNVNLYIEKKGKLKPKKLQNLIQSLKPSDAGPYSCTEYRSPSGKTVAIEQVNVADLHDELNTGKVVVGKVAAIVPYQSPVPFPFVLVDAEGECIAVTVYNIAAGKGVNAGDSVAIPEPYVQKTKAVISDEEVLEFRSIRVDNPVTMVVNKRKIGAEKLAFSVLQVTNKSD